MNQSITPPRIEYIDTLRVIACLMVILVHSPHPHEGLTEALSYGLISYLCSPCIGLFLMISGALLLPIKFPTKQFISRRLTRILIPLAVWSIIYIAIYVFQGQLKPKEIFTQILNIPISTVIGFAQGWYLYLLVGIYLFLPIINSWIKENTQKRTLYFIFLWIIVMFSPYITAIFGNFNENTLAPFAGYFGYVVLGYYLHNYPLNTKTTSHKISFALIVLLISGILPALVYFANIPNYNTYKHIVYNYLSISTVVMCVYIYVFFQKHYKWTRLFSKAIKSFSELSFGIFLVNYIIISGIFRPYFIENPMPNVETEITITFIGSTALSYMAIWVISKLPFRKYIIG